MAVSSGRALPKIFESTFCTSRVLTIPSPLISPKTRLWAAPAQTEIEPSKSVTTMKTESNRFILKNLTLYIKTISISQFDCSTVITN